MLSIRIDNGVLLAARVRVISSFWERHRPFGRWLLEEDRGLLWNPGGSVHTFGMPGAVDVAFLDTQWRVLQVMTAMSPGRWAWPPRGTRQVLLLAAERSTRAGLLEGMSLSQDNPATPHACATTVLRRV